MPALRGNGNVHIADMTMFYAPSSGGVRTYLEAKRTRLVNSKGVRHSLLIPGTPASATPVADMVTHIDSAKSSPQARLQVVRVPAPPLPFSSGYRFPLRRHHWLDTLAHLRPDVLEAGDPYVTGWAAVEASQRFGMPIVGFYHSDLPEMLGSRFGHRVRAWTERYIRRLYRHYDRILAPSQLMAERLNALDIANVHVQPLGVDIDLFTPSRRDVGVRQELGLDEDTHLLIFAGRGSQEKNLPVLLNAMRALGTGYHLLMVGSNMPSQTPDNVTTINHFCPPAELARLIASSDALLHAGTQETFGLVILEAMASGIPVVAANAGALPESIDERFGRLSAPLDAQDMARATRELFTHDVRAMGRIAREQAERHHGWDAVVASVQQHYNAVLHTDHSGTSS